MPAGSLHALLSSLLHRSAPHRQYRKAERSRLLACASSLLDAACQRPQQQQQQQQSRQQPQQQQQHPGARQAAVGKAVLAVAAVQDFTSQACYPCLCLVPVPVHCVCWLCMDAQCMLLHAQM